MSLKERVGCPLLGITFWLYMRDAGDRGSRITLLGLFVNVGLTSAKGIAGWYMHSASLLADAGHSLSGTFIPCVTMSILIAIPQDLLGDFVTLFCWKLSRKPPSERYPYGFAKFETLGTTTVSFLLIGGALGIGFHSYHLLMEALSGTVPTLPPGQLHDILQHVASVGHHVPSVGHAHTHVDVLDPNAAWFAAVSVLLKEWLYRITKKVADEEHSPVLYANAVHHRSDAYSSFVALFAILGSSIFPALPLDPLGGTLAIRNENHATTHAGFDHRAARVVCHPEARRGLVWGCICRVDRCWDFNELAR